VREPSAVLFNLLTLLIHYPPRISGSTDPLTGENPGQNTPATNMTIMVEQGMNVYSAIFKRLWRSMRDEFRKLYLLNGRHMPARVPFGEETVGRELFLDDPSQLVPAADPNLISPSAKIEQAVTIKQAAATTPGYNMDAVERNFLRAMHVDAIDLMFPGVEKLPPAKDPKMAIEELKTQRIQMELAASREQFMIEMMETARLNNAKILQLQAQAQKLLADAQGADVDRQIAAMDTMIAGYQAHNDSINKRMEIMQKGRENGDGNSEGGTPGMAPPPGDEGLQGAPAQPSGIPEGAMGLGGLQ
jgi:chaperonin GroES